MSRKIWLLAILGAVLGCGPRVRVVAPPAIFPAATAWMAPLDEAIEGSIASDGTRVFLFTREGSVRAFDLASGAALWRLPLQASALAARPGLLVLREPNGTVRAIDPASGSVRWQNDTGVVGGLPPVLWGDQVLVVGKGLASLDAASGSTLWTLPDLTSEVPPALSADRIYLVSEGGVLRCHALRSGAILWTRKTGFSSLGTPLAARGRLYLAAGSRALAAFDARNGKQRWRWKVGAQALFEPVELGKNVLFVTQEGVLYSLNKRNGHLSFRTALPSRPASGPLLLGSAALVASHGLRPREALVVTLDGRDGQRLGDLNTVAELACPPLLVGQTLVLGLRDRNAVMALRLGALDEP